MDIPCGKRMEKGAPGLLGMTVKEIQDLLLTIGITPTNKRADVCKQAQEAITKGLLNLNNKSLPLCQRFSESPAGRDFVSLCQRFLQPFDLCNVPSNYKISTYVLNWIKSTITHQDRLKIIIDELKIKNVCFENIYMFSVGAKDIELMLPNYPYLKQLLDSIKNKRYRQLPFRFSADIQSYPVFSNSQIQSLIFSNKQSIAKMELCNYDILRLHIGYIVSKSKETSDIRIPANQGFAAHSAQVIINLRTKKAFMLESSINDNPGGQNLEYLKEESVEVFLRYYIDFEIDVIRTDFDVCPPVKLQGKTQLCAVWSLYLFILYLLNPDVTREEFFKVFDEYSQKERNRLISNFAYHIERIVKRSK